MQADSSRAVVVACFDGIITNRRQPFASSDHGIRRVVVAGVVVAVVAMGESGRAWKVYPCPEYHRTGKDRREACESRHDRDSSVDGSERASLGATLAAIGVDRTELERPFWAMQGQGSRLTRPTSTAFVECCSRGPIGGANNLPPKPAVDERRKRQIQSNDRKNEASDKHERPSSSRAPQDTTEKNREQLPTLYLTFHCHRGVWDRGFLYKRVLLGHEDRLGTVALGKRRDRGLLQHLGLILVPQPRLGPFDLWFMLHLLIFIVVVLVGHRSSLFATCNRTVSSRSSHGRLLSIRLCFLFVSVLCRDLLRCLSVVVCVCVCVCVREYSAFTFTQPHVCVCVRAPLANKPCFAATPPRVLEPKTRCDKAAQSLRARSSCWCWPH